MILGDIELGRTIKIGDREYLVVGRGYDTTSVLSKDIIINMEFGESNDYKESKIRTYLNEEFISELELYVDERDLVPHRIHLIADDGTNKDDSCCDQISLITADLYRRYRKYIPPIGRSWWTATPKSKMDDWLRNVCHVYSDGVLDWHYCVWSCGVRPFFVLRSSMADFAI